MSDEASPVSQVEVPRARPGSFTDVLRQLVGKVVTMVNPESLEEAPTGYQLTRGFYRAKVVGVGSDFVTVVVEFVHRRRDKSKETAKQYIPVSRIKRLSVMKAETFLHI